MTIYQTYTVTTLQMEKFLIFPWLFRRNCTQNGEQMHNLLIQLLREHQV